MNHRLLSLVTIWLISASPVAAGPPWPQPLQNVRSLRVSGIKTQAEADQVMTALRELTSVWSVSDLSPESGYVRVGWDVRAVNEHALAQTIMNQGDFAVTTHFQIGEYAAHAADVGQVLDQIRQQYPVRIECSDRERGIFELTYLPIQLDPQNLRKVGLAGGYLHHPLSVDKPPKGLGLKFTDLSAPRGLRSLMPKTLMTFRGRLLFSEDFREPVTFADRIDRSADTWQPGWRVKSGVWSVAEERLRGVANPSAHHPATLHYPLPFQNVVIQVDMRLDETPTPDVPSSPYQSARLVIREADAGHLASVAIGRNGFSARKDASQPGRLVDVPNDGEAMSFGHHPIEIRSGEWRTMILEVLGDELVATIDGGNPIAGRHPIVGLPKGVFNLAASPSASFRNLRVFEALPNPDWKNLRETLLKGAGPRSSTAPAP